ncbi:hypothetical protein [Thiohalobacter thiocyanaticus]|uniref:hypothetical protein n=1 Tax=Thiohalobacter thiocyanaticus TaxID=585455 RepID=UPI000F63BF00|nr:hypothetical protein [Thiohalobacter thiocyanaticus]
MSDTYRKALDFQEKFELYFVSLTFALLALVIQSADSSSGIVAGVAEIIGWVSLLISGLVQLYRLQLVPVALRYEAATKEGVSVDKKDQGSVHTKISSTYGFSKWSFALGVCSILLSRGIGFVSGLCH